MYGIYGARKRGKEWVKTRGESRINIEVAGFECQIQSSNVRVCVVFYFFYQKFSFYIYIGISNVFSSLFPSLSFK